MQVVDITEVIIQISVSQP